MGHRPARSKGVNAPNHLRRSGFMSRPPDHDVSAARHDTTVQALVPLNQQYDQVYETDLIGLASLVLRDNDPNFCLALLAALGRSIIHLAAVSSSGVSSIPGDMVREPVQVVRVYTELFHGIESGLDVLCVFGAVVNHSCTGQGDDRLDELTVPIYTWWHVPAIVMAVALAALERIGWLAAVWNVRR